MTATLTSFENHPCFDRSARHLYGRIHLPVAPRCNVSCNYCNRKFDCASESRPGVTSAILSPAQALYYLTSVLEKEPRIAVVGIAGPGDPFANPKETMETLRLVRAKFPHILLCVSSNGLNILPYVDELAELEVSHVTITINAVDPKIGEKVYKWVRDGKMTYRGRIAAELMISRQLSALKALKDRGLVAKVNCVLSPGINDQHIPEIAEKVGLLGADLMNCIPLFPTEGTPFYELPEPNAKMTARVRLQAGQFLPQMTHCMRCRADSVGFLNDPRTDEFRELLIQSSRMPLYPEENRPNVAVATMEGALVNLHLGEAEEFHIYSDADESRQTVDVRKAPLPGDGDLRWDEIAKTLKDCRAVLVSAIGGRPREVLEKSGIKVIEMVGTIQDGLDVVYKGVGGGCTGGKAGMGCG